MKRLLALVFLACAPAPITSGQTFGDTHSGSYHLGPVDWQGTQWNNACSPYPPAVQALEGQYLAGVDNAFNGNGQLCDACALITTRLGKSVLVRIVTTGVSNAPGDVDLSAEAYAAIHQDDPMGTPSNPRPMTWQLAKCAGQSRIHLQYQTQANTDWTSLWVRNARLPLEGVRVKSSRHTTSKALRRESDGTWNDDSGFGAGAFTLELTSTTGVTLSQDFQSFAPGALVETTLQFE